MSIADRPIHCPKEKHFDTVQNSGGHSLSCYSDWNLFSSSLSYLWANFAPYKGKIPAHPLGRIYPLDGKKTAPYRAVAENAVCPVPTLQDAGIHACVFQFNQRNFDRPLVQSQGN